MVDRYYKFHDFDPAWVFEDAFKASAPARGALDPFVRWDSWRVMHEEYKNAYDAGRHIYLLYALRRCACNDLPFPDWVANEFIKKYDRWLSGRERILDDAFGVALSNKAHRELKKRRVVWPPLAAEVAKRRESKPVNNALYGEIAKKFNVKKRTVRTAYDAVNKQLGNEPPQPRPNSPTARTKAKRAKK